MDIEKDKIFELAERYVNCTGRSVFLTGKAGTGKTTFLKYIAQSTMKRFVILAPTGVAAINAGGSTIHSFFQLPLCPYLPDVKELITEYQTPDKYRSLKKERQKIIRTLDLLIIDEISMVRADILDAVDMTLRRYRHNDLPFGGVQLLMIGDAQQLSPVVKEDERQYMQQVYPSPYFFHSKALQKLSYITIELQKVHRQKDADSLEILNAVRENRVTSSVLTSLNSRLHAYEDDGETIRLTTHNAQADGVNSSKLDALEGKMYQFEAEIEGEFPENIYPTDYVLSLKEGAQVMFVRNDTEGQYYNGKIGKVISIRSNGAVEVECAGRGDTIWVNPVEWENIQYELNEEGEIVPVVVGRYRQLPLRVAWAITIHKSQGLTFDKVIIDAGAAFAFGQVYVALSRCRSLEGISLESPVRLSGICSDMHVAEFNAAIPSVDSVLNSLDREELGYHFDMLCELFRMDEVVRLWEKYRRTWSGSVEKVYDTEYRGLLSRATALEDARDVAMKFERQLRYIQQTKSGDDTFLRERVRKAAGYFLPILEDAREFSLTCAVLEIDNKETKTRAKDAAEQLQICLDIKCRGVESVSESGEFVVADYNRVKTECNLEDRKFTRKSARVRKLEGSSATVNEELRERLQAWRNERFKQDNIPAYMIMHQSTLLSIASLVPQTKKDLLSIKGFGEASFKKYGEEILAITAEFAQ
jgi:hypothetical protein